MKTIELKEGETAAELSARAKNSAGDTPEPDSIIIDGAKLDAFVEAVKGLGKILEQIKVWDIKEIFIRSKEVDGIDDIINTRHRWSEMMREVASALNKDVENQEKMVLRGRQFASMLGEIQRANKQSIELTPGVSNLVNLLDRLEKHRQSGLLDALNDLVKR